MFISRLSEEITYHTYIFCIHFRNCNIIAWSLTPLAFDLVFIVLMVNNL